MYFVSSPLGCLLWSALLIWIFFKLKLYYVIFAIILFAVFYNIFSQIKSGIKQQKINKELNFEPKMGEVSKICPECGNDVRRSAEVCPHCGYKFD